MSRPARLLWWGLLALLAACPLAVSANPCADPGGIGGTGHSAPGPGEEGADPGGIGGSGIHAAGPNREVGIVGTITGFASICVNGIEVHYDHRTPIVGNGRSLLRSLHVGQLVAISASLVGTRLEATRVDVVSEIVGPVTRVAPGRIEVMGRGVDVSRVVTTEEAAGSGIDDLRTGDFVRVSGLPRLDSTIEASRVVLERGDTATVRGRLDGSAAGEPRIAGVAVRLPGDAALDDGRLVQATGTWEGSALRVKRIEADAVLARIDGLPRLELQGYPTRDAAGNMELWGQRVQLDTSTVIEGGSAAALGDGRMVRISARALPDGRMVATRVSFPKAPADWRGESGRRGKSSGGGGNGDRIEAMGQSSMMEDDDAPGKGSKPDSRAKPAKPDRGNKSERPEKSHRPDKAERVEKAQRPDKIERPAKPERPDKVERPEKAERPERVDRPEKVERPDKPERPEKPERPDKPERPQRVDKPERPRK